jgi:hypothetical protein
MNSSQKPIRVGNLRAIQSSKNGSYEDYRGSMQLNSTAVNLELQELQSIAIGHLRDLTIRQVAHRDMKDGGAGGGGGY